MAKIGVDNIDFDDLKDSLKNFLQRDDSPIKDYNFEGSAMSVLLDVLAYNTHMNILYNNMALNESFLDSASRRDSVVSLAKALGYTPKSATCSKAEIEMTMTITDEDVPIGAVATLPKHSKFVTNIGDVNYVFYNTEAVSAVGDEDNAWTFKDIVLTGGTLVRSLIEKTSDDVKYIIPNPNMDVNTLTVKVQPESTSDNYEKYNIATGILDVKSDSRVFFLKENEGREFEVYFGDNIVGKKPADGSIIHLEYFTSNLGEDNGAERFTYNGSTIDILKVPSEGAGIKVIKKSYGGGVEEDVESIRFSAPKHFAAQDRAVSPGDFSSIILRHFSNAKSVNVWGGEDNIPPVYGKVFISVLPNVGEKLSSVEKNEITNGILKNRTMATLSYELVDINFIDIILNVTVNYDANATSAAANDIKLLVRNSLENHSEEKLNRFDGVFRYSEILKLVDESSNAIINNTTTVKLKRSVDVKFNQSSSYEVILLNPIHKQTGGGGIKTGYFFIKGSGKQHFIEDDGKGNLNLMQLSDDKTAVIVKNTGTVDYEIGKISISGLNVVEADSGKIILNIIPSSFDVVSSLNQVIRISDITINTIADNTAAGDLAGGKNYIHSSIVQS